ncbi:Mg/Co/Ni transporter [Candidatus Scalindua japonica]|uniref:Mg/Co/Ni transporter n=1 Tax=Candidatus Scalindua japonica TaxID=1284222 RepID=A0A286TTZ8_9BACT|nr:hypothetical protein [Candidatus Scalindua japonica]GAX59357.1 Mg/Co/Ni transporter [Candidatus Scalindua japonica]
MVIKKLTEEDYEKLARIVDGLNETEVLEIMKVLPNALSAKVISALPPNLVATLLIQLPSDLLEKIIGDLAISYYIPCFRIIKFAVLIERINFSLFILLIYILFHIGISETAVLHSLTH